MSIGAAAQSNRSIDRQTTESHIKCDLESVDAAFIALGERAGELDGEYYRDVKKGM